MTAKKVPTEKLYRSKAARDEDLLGRMIDIARTFGPKAGGSVVSSWRFGISGGLLTLEAQKQLFARFENRSQIMGEARFAYSVTSGDILSWIKGLSKKKARPK
jgi:hypothetical protein